LLSCAPVALSALLFPCLGDHRHLHSFPTRRSSDLELLLQQGEGEFRALPHPLLVALEDAIAEADVAAPQLVVELVDVARELVDRSEEHTSELQSRENLVCRLLLEKKNKKHSCHRSR